jgi:hypothetical protein
VAVRLVVFDVPKGVTVPGVGRRVIVLERRLQAVPMMAFVPSRLSRRGHDDVRVAVALCAVGPMGVLDDLEQPMHVRFGFVVMAVLVLVSVAVRHGSMLGQA